MLEIEKVTLKVLLTNLKYCIFVHNEIVKNDSFSSFFSNVENMLRLSLCFRFLAKESFAQLITKPTNIREQTNISSVIYQLGHYWTDHASCSLLVEDMAL